MISVDFLCFVCYPNLVLPKLLCDMKKLLTLLIAAMSVISCSWDEYLGTEGMSPDKAEDSTVVMTQGNFSAIRTKSGVIFVEVDSVKIAEGYETINVNDTIYRTPWNVDLTSANILRTEVLQHTVKELHENYIVYELRVRFYFRYYDVCVPIIFTRDFVSAIRANGTDDIPHHSYRYNIIAGQYRSTEPLITDEESHSRSYYDLVIDVKDQDEQHLGTLLIQLSFYTANASITFGGEMNDFKENTTETNL